MKAAVQNGADSVYFGASNFNARASASNFDLTNLKDAISYAKLRGVNTHLTLNTLIKDSEFEEAVLLAQKAYEFGIDAIIVQDLGLASYLIENFPDLPIHASTQMTIHNLEGVKKIESLGFKRAVLSRELSLEEIEYICSNSNIEIECFIHGALCICYSGQCLFSSMVGGRSGNRGKCAQPCRLPYELICENSSKELCFSLNGNVTKETEVTKLNVPNEKGYLLSPRDLCGLDYLPKLIAAGVMCFKIEGRMKSPEYVATVTRIYRKYIDLALSDQTYVVDKNDVEELAQVFNRGNFSSGHLSSQANKDLIYPKKPNNIGIYIGNVSNLKPNKGHILVSLNHSVSLGDSITFENENTTYTISELMLKGKNIDNAKKGQFVEIGRMKGNIHSGDKIYRIASKDLSTLAKLSYKTENKKTHLTCKIKLEKEKPIIFEVKTINNQSLLFKDIKVSLNSDTIVPLEALSRPITKERIIEQINKTNDTIFIFDKIDVDLDNNLFLPSIKVLNELRRNALEQINIIAQNRILRRSPNLPEIIISKKADKKTNKSISVLLNILHEDYNYVDLQNINQVYIPLKYFSNKKYEKNIESISNRFDTYIYLPPIIKSNYKNLLINVIDNSIDRFSVKGFVISNLSSFGFIDIVNKKYKDKFKYIGNYTLNIYNQYTTQKLHKLGLERLTISPELDNMAIQSITNNNIDKEIIVYGRVPLMNINYCLLGKTNRCYPTCGSLCQDEKVYYLKDRLGLNFRIIPDNIQTVSTIYNSKITSISADNFNVSSYRIDVLDENIKQINLIAETVISGKRFEGKEYTNGNLNREI